MRAKRGGFLKGKSKYEITAVGREFVTGREYKTNLSRILSDLRQQGKAEEEVLTAAFVYTATCLIMNPSGEMQVDVDRMQEFIEDNKEVITTALTEALRERGRS